MSFWHLLDSFPDDVSGYYFLKSWAKLSINGSTYAGACALHHEYVRGHDSHPYARVHVRAYHLYGNTFWIHLRFRI